MKDKKTDNSILILNNNNVNSKVDTNSDASYNFKEVNNLVVDSLDVNSFNSNSVISAYDAIGGSQDEKHVSLLPKEDFSNNSVVYAYNNIAEDVNFVVDHSFMAFDEIQEFEDTSSAIMINEEDNEFGNLIYEETRGGDFLESAVEETLPYFLEKNESGSDIYKILKGSLDENHNVEIWDYNQASAKIDIADFVKEYGDSLGYTLHQQDGDVTLHVTNQNDVNEVGVDIIFKDTDFGSGNLDDIIKNLILTGGNKD